MALILGIDPGSRITGYGVVSAVGNRQEYITSGCIKTTEKTTLPERLAVIYQGLSTIIDEFVPAEAAIERIFMAKSPESALKLGHARGVALLAAVNRDIPVHEYEARKVKQAVVGSGSATKNQVQHMVMTLLRLPAKPQADAADALAIAICHINTQYNLARMANNNANAVGIKRFRRGRWADQGDS